MQREYTEQEVEQLIDGENWYWDGWTLCQFIPDHGGYIDPRGSFRNGSWGYTVKFPITERGTWLIGTQV